MPTLKQVAYSPNSKAYFSYFEGESDGYMFKINTFPEIEKEVNDMLAAEEDLSIKCITFAQGHWFVHAEHVETPPSFREFKMFKSFDAMRKGVENRVASQKALRAVHCHETTWATYFEGEIEGKVCISISDTSDEMLQNLNTQVVDEELSLECICWGEDAWYAFFLEHPSFEQGDATWCINSKYVGDGSFVKAVEEHMDKDDAMRAVAFGGGVWFGYWEGSVPEDAGWSWLSKPTMQELQDAIKTEWEADEEDDTMPAENEPAAGSSRTLKRPKKKAAEQAATSKIDTPSASTSSKTSAGTASTASTAVTDMGDELGEYGGFQLAVSPWPETLPEKDAKKFEKQWTKEVSKAAKKFIKEAKKSKMAPEDCTELRQKAEASLMVVRKLLDAKAEALAVKLESKKKKK